MSLKLFMVLVTALVVQNTTGQEINKAEIIRFKIKSITAIESDGNIKFIELFDERGDMIRRESYNQGEKEERHVEYVYNDSSQLTEERTGRSGKIIAKTKYYYNNKSQIVKKESFSDDDGADATWNYEYDQNGNRVIETQESGTMGNYSIEFKYDKNNMLIQEDKENNTIGKEARVTYKYSENGQLIEKSIRHYFFGGTIRDIYIYNNNGKLIKLVEKSSNGVSSTTTYEYDEKGLLVSYTWLSSIGREPYKTTYQIKYE